MVVNPACDLPPGLLSRRFPRAYRLTLPTQFAASLNSRNILRSAHFALHWRLNGLPVWRLGLVISKRFAARAVERNVHKRAWREAFRIQLAPLLMQGGTGPACDVVVRLLPPPKGAPAPRKKRAAPVKPVALRLLRQQSHAEATSLMRQIVARVETMRGLDRPVQASAGSGRSTAA